jgi:hypothetical protein
MKQFKIYVLALLGWIALAGYFLYRDADAFVLFVMLSPVSILFLIISIKIKNIALTIISTFFLIAHGINPAIFFIERERFDYYGWGAIKDFQFSVANLLETYKWVYLSMALIIFFSFFIRKLFTSAYHAKTTKKSNNVKIETHAKSIKSSTYTALIIILIILATPLSIYMYANKVGIVGIENTRLPFKLSGALYYFRNYILPVIIFALYKNTKRGIWLAMFILFYASLASLTSVSRSVLVLTALPVIFFSVLDGKLIRLATTGFLIVILFSVISAARGPVFESLGSMPLGEVISTLEVVSMNANYSFIEIITDLVYEVFVQFSGRLYGAQDMVLTYQYNIQNQLPAIINFFVAQPIIDDAAFEIYGLELQEGMAFGVNFGLFGALMILANENIFVLSILTLIISVFLYLSEISIQKIASMEKISALTYPVGFLLVFSMYDLRMSIFYFLLIFLSLSLHVINKFYYKSKRVIH